MRVYLFAFIILLITGCTTVEFVRKDFTPVKQGVLRYYPTNSAKREAQYQEKIKTEATNFCGGNYQITKEYQAREETGTSAGIGTGIGLGSGGIGFGTAAANTAMYNFVEFSCVK